MASKIGICNQTLLRLGEPPLVSLDVSGKAANALKAIWDEARDRVLAEHPWNFATRRAILAPAAAAPDFGYDYAYPLPADCLRVWVMADSDGKPDPTLFFKVEGDQLLTDESAARIEYVARVTEPGRFSPGFAGALAAYLAKELAYYLSEDPGLAKLMVELYESQELPAARAIDGQEGTPVAYEANPWLEARL